MPMTAEEFLNSREKSQGKMTADEFLASRRIPANILADETIPSDITAVNRPYSRSDELLSSLPGEKVPERPWTDISRPGMIPKGTTEKVVDWMSKMPGKFAPGESGFMPVPEDLSFGEKLFRGANNLMQGGMTLGAGVAGSALEDPVGTAGMVAGFYPQVGQKLSKAFLGAELVPSGGPMPFMPMPVSEEEQKESQRELWENPFEPLLALLPVLSGLKSMAKTRGFKPRPVETSKTNIIKAGKAETVTMQPAGIYPEPAKITTLTPSKETAPLTRTELPPVKMEGLPETPLKLEQTVFIQLPKHKKPHKGTVKDIVYDNEGNIIKVNVKYHGEKGSFVESLPPENIIIPQSTQSLREYHKALSEIPPEKRAEVKANSKKFDDVLRENLEKFIPEEEIQSAFGELKTPSSRQESMIVNNLLKQARDKASEVLKAENLDSPVGRANALKTLENYIDKNKGMRREAPVDKVDMDYIASDVPFSKGKATIEKSLLPKKDEVVGISHVRDYFSRGMDVPIRTGMFRHRAEGIYKRKPQVIRMRDWGDIPTLTHEIAHHIDNIYGINEIRKSSTELKKMDYDQTKMRTEEGFAEYVRMRLTGDEASAKILAPEFTEKFDKYLTDNPELQKFLKGGQDLITRWREQGAANRVYSQIDVQGKGVKGKIVDKIGSGLRKVGTLFVDDIIPLEYVEKKMRGVTKLDPNKIDPATSPTMIARAESKTAKAKARSMILEGTFDFAGQKTGKSLKEIISPIRDNMKNFLIYAYARRSVDLWKRDINPGINKFDAEFLIRDLKKPGFDTAVKEITDFQDRIMQYAVDAGVLSKEAAQIIRDLNPVYIPLKRVLEDAHDYAMTGGKNMADLGSPFKRIKGSGRPIKNPLHSIIKSTAEIISIADKVRVGKALIELAEKTEGAGKWFDEVKLPASATKVSLKDIRKQLEDAGVDLAEADMGDIITFYSNAQKYVGKDNVVSFWRDGKRQFYEVNPELYGTLKALDNFNLPPFVDFLFGKPSRAVRLGATGLQAGFSLITNPLRDTFTFALQSEYVSFLKKERILSLGLPYEVAVGMAKKLYTKNEYSQLFRRSGSEMSYFLGLDRKHMKRMVDEIRYHRLRDKVDNVVEHPLEVLGSFHPIERIKEGLGFTESGPRLAEFEAAYKKGESLYGKKTASARIMAANASADVTVNFRRMGVYGAAINQMIPFWNAQIQGVAKFGRYVREHPFKAGTKGVATLTVPTALIWNENKDKDWYRESPDWLKYGFWQFEVGTNPDGSPKILRMPRPFEWGVVFSMLPEMALDYAYNKDPEIINEGLGYMAEATLPLTRENLPHTIKLAVEQWTNYDFFRERAIDPYFEIEYKEPEDRYSPYTTETAKFIGKQFGMSPRKIEHLIGGGTGGLGMDVIRAGESVAGVEKKLTEEEKAKGWPTGKEEKPGHPENIPVVGRLFTRQTSPEERERRIYYAKENIQQEVIKKLKAGKISDAADIVRTWNRKYPAYKIEFDSSNYNKGTP